MHHSNIEHGDLNEIRLKIKQVEGGRRPPFPSALSGFRWQAERDYGKSVIPAPAAGRSVQASPSHITNGICTTETSSQNVRSERGENPNNLCRQRGPSMIRLLRREPSWWTQLLNAVQTAAAVEIRVRLGELLGDFEMAGCGRGYQRRKLK